jgi:hypothetical protein
MTPKLSEDQRQAITEHGGAPVYVVDAATNATYVLLRAEQFEKMKAITDGDDVEAMYPLIDEVMKEDWDDPAMKVYDDYDAHRPKP